VTDCSVKPAAPESASKTETSVWTSTSLWLRGHSAAGVASHVTVGGVVSILKLRCLGTSTLPAGSMLAAYRT